ncbi:DUF551 domain-containing protein [Acinetobacter radioresistens]|jgi:hypothetical protein|uniref:DUF551 domain-containing protein n=1 Tax=Acinetobacter radioresistens TaxID=40216 RepID=UPI0011A6BAA7|nr:DUF551 domain-containing protein [Acinetobacter radioresistens]MCK4113714.1 DUF551 domain-containing protein [Acinetobacter radioresistens]MCU4621332.1 DUF551 domain-containing protein [Acinetobacter radioresistens]
MDIQKVKELALANGFKLKEQASGNMDLNAYVYDFANAVEREVKAQAVPEWISVEDKLPETEPNTDGVVCAVVCSLGNVYRARYMHDVDIGVDTKYWSEFAVNYNGREYEHYEINAKITHWMPLPDAPQEPAND